MPKQEINLVIPMAGQGKRFLDSGETTIKPLLLAHGLPLFQWAIKSFDSLQHQFKINIYCIVLEEHIQKYHLASIIKKTYPHATIVSLIQPTRGQAETVLQAKPFLNPALPLLIFNNDTYFKCADLGKTINSDIDGAIVCFESNKPNYSYVLADATRHILKTAEKEVISPNASNGLYYFKQGADFFEKANTMISNQEKQAGEYYVIPVYNNLIKVGKKIKMVLADKNYIFGTPRELEKFRTSQDIQTLRGDC